MCWYVAQVTSTEDGYGAELGSLAGSFRADRTAVYGQRVGIDVAEGDTSLSLRRCAKAMSLSNQWHNTRSIGLDIMLHHGPVTYTGSIEPTTSEVTLHMQPVFFVQIVDTGAVSELIFSNQPQPASDRQGWSW